jgi:arylsulfatase A-like enzyme
MTRVGALRPLALSGAIFGLRAWVAYWMVESVFWVLLPWFLKPSYNLRPADSLFAAVALSLYMIAGAVLGALIAICLGVEFPRVPQESFPLIGPLSLTVVFTALGPVTGERFQVIVAVSIAAASILGLAGIAGSGWRRLIANPWLVPLVLLGCPFLMVQDDWISAAGCALVIVAAILAAFFLARRYNRNSQRLSQSVSTNLGSCMLWLSAIVVLLGCHVFLKQQPILSGPRPSSAIEARAAGHPNVILISMDTVRADHLSVYGYARDTSPVLQEFARHATVFTNAISAGDMTLTSHASMFTGMYGSQHGAHWQLGKNRDGVAMGDEVGLPLPENRLTLATILSRKGYRTAGIVANTTYLQHAFHLDHGFQYYDQPYPKLFFDRRDPFYLRTDLARFLGHFSPHAISDLAYLRAAEVNDKAFELLTKTKGEGRPLFLFLNYMDAHHPYFPPPPYDVKYRGRDKTFSAIRYRALEFQVLSRVRNYTDADRKRDFSQYDGGIAYLDAQLGQLFGKLKELGLWDNSLIIVTSDHGQSFGEKQLVAHGSSVYQEQVHVPLIIKYPGTADGQKREDLASHVDILPTVLDTLGFQYPALLPGRSLRTAPGLPITVISESFPCDLLANLNPRFRRTERAAFFGPFKLIIATNGEREFYDLSQDPFEQRNLYASRLPMADRLEDGLRRWIAASPVVHSRPAALDKQEIERLKSLGYLQ